MNRMTNRAEPPHRNFYQSGVKDSRGWSEQPSVTESSCAEDEIRCSSALPIKNTPGGAKLDEKVLETKKAMERATMESLCGKRQWRARGRQARTPRPSPCPDCAAKDKMIKVLERQLAELKAATPQPVRVSEESDGRASCNACGAALQGPFYQCRESKAWKLCSNCGGREKFCNAKGEFDHVFQNKRVNS